MEAGDLHEDEAALRLAAAVRGPGPRPARPQREPRRPPRRAARACSTSGRARSSCSTGSTRSRCSRRSTGPWCAAGQLVASVKVAPHVVPASIVERGVAIAACGPAAAGLGRAVRADAGRRAGQGVAAGRRPGALRAERPGQGGVAGLVGRALRLPARRDGRRRDGARVDDDAGRRPMPSTSCSPRAAGRPTPATRSSSRSRRVGGRLIRRGVPAHPGSMLWLGRVGQTAVLGLPDLRRLLEGDRRRPAAAAAAHRRAADASGRCPGWVTAGILTRDMRFRFPAYARAARRAGRLRSGLPPRGSREPDVGAGASYPRAPMQPIVEASTSGADVAVDPCWPGAVAETSRRAADRARGRPRRRPPAGHSAATGRSSRWPASAAWARAGWPWRSPGGRMVRRDGRVAFVPLDGVSDASLVLPAIAGAMGVPTSPAGPRRVPRRGARPRAQPARPRHRGARARRRRPRSPTSSPARPA